MTGIFTVFIFIVLAQPQDKSSEIFKDQLPVIVIDTNGQDITITPEIEEVEVDGIIKLQAPKSERFKAGLSLYRTNPFETSTLLKPEVESDIIINTRGQSSLRYQKKQYTIRLVDENGYNNPKEMINMPKHDKWVLNGLYSDKSLMRNYLAYQMGRQTMDYAPDTRYVEVYLKNHNDKNIEEYQGIYLLTEKIERDINRVNISNNIESYNDTSFIMARDKVKLGDEIFTSDWNELEEDYVVLPVDKVKNRTVFTVSYPNKDNMTDKNRENILKSLNDFEYALQSENFDDKNNGYNKYIDVDSFIKFAMIQEITKNIDGGEVSSFFYKDIGEKIKAGPVWDFDMSMKNTDDVGFNNPTGFSMLNTVWYDRLFQDDFFASRYEKVYKKYRQTIWSDRNIDALIDQALIKVMPAVENNIKKWYPKDNMETYLKEIEDLRKFLKTRLNWMDDNIHLVKRITENVVE